MAPCLAAAWPTSQSALNIVMDLDDSLVEAAKAGDTNAFAELLQRHQRFCLAKAYSILKNLSDAEDEVQSAWVRVWTRLGSYQSQGAFRAWLSRIVANQCLMRLRKFQSAPTTSVDEVFDSEGSFRLEVIDPSELPEQVVANRQAMRVLGEEIRAVPPLLRKVLVMRDLRELAMEDIAEDLGLSLPATKSRLLRARAELRKRLEKHDVESGCGPWLQQAERPRVAYVRQ